MSLLILNFHGVGPVLRNTPDSERVCWLDEDRFNRILDLLTGKSHIRLTFDDGNASDVDIALSALMLRGLSATFFVCATRLDRSTFLSRTQVRELLACGMRIGSHGLDHCSWRHLSAGQLQGEVERSRQILEMVCNAPVDVAACPFGEYDRSVLKALFKAGYRVVYTSDEGLAYEGDRIQARTTITRAMPMDDIEHLVRRGPSVLKQWSINARKLWKRFR